MKKISEILIALLCSTLLVSCTVDTAGTSSDVDVEIASLKGSVLTLDKTPVEGAIISLYEESDTVLVASEISGITGEYLFDSVGNGEYTVTASLDDSVYAIIQSIMVEKDLDSIIELDTLWLVKPGVISGSVSNYDGNGVVWIYIPGTSFIATVDSGGIFVMSGVAPDSNYTVKYERYGYSSVAISGVTVTSGDTTYLEPQSLTSNMYPQGLSATYDTLSNVVNLSWSRMSRDDIEGYVISRKLSDLSAVTPEEINDVLIIDTIFSDTLHDTLFSKSDTVSFHYQVQGQTYGFGERTGYSLPVIVKALISRDSSDYQSIIVTSPSSGDTLQGFEASMVSWNYTGKVDSVKVFLTLDGGKNWNPISGVIPNRGEYLWPKVENAQSSSCQIKVVSNTNSAVLGISSVFSISLTPVDNILANGDFSKGFKNWIPNIHSYDTAVEGSMEIDSSGVLHVTTLMCDEAWKIRIYQYPETPLYSSYEYEISFKAKSTIFQKLTAGAHTIRGEYAHFANATVYVDTMWQEFKESFIPVGDPQGDNTVVSFVFGEEVGQVWLDDIVIRVVGVK